MRQRKPVDNTKSVESKWNPLDEPLPKETRKWPFLAHYVPTTLFVFLFAVHFEVVVGNLSSPYDFKGMYQLLFSSAQQESLPTSILGVCSLSILFSSISFLANYKLIPVFAQKLSKAGICGQDLNKLDSAGKYSMKLVPESLGTVTSVTFLLSSFITQILFSRDTSVLLLYNAGLATLTFMAFLGFIDDVLQLRWRYKMVLPLLASVPMVLAYNGSSTMIVPRAVARAVTVVFDLTTTVIPLNTRIIPEVIGDHAGSAASALVLLDLKLLYKAYTAALVVFCSNAINIYAGINGLEVGQSIIMSMTIIVNSVYQLYVVACGQRQETTFQDVHHSLFALVLSFPFLTTSLSLFCYNRYPSKVFVGNTYTCFAGTYFAVVGILGHTSRLLLPLFLPQVVNFVVSIPQLVGLLPCPRHRIPRIDRHTGKLKPSPGNWTLINIVLRLCGPMREETLVSVLLAIQFVWSVFLMAWKVTLQHLS